MDDFRPRFFVVWSRIEQRFLSITFDPTGGPQSVGGSGEMIVREKQVAKEADDLAERLNTELSR